MAEAQGLALQMHEFDVVNIFDLKFGWDLDEVGVSFGQLVALQVHEVVVFVGGEDFFLHYEIVLVKQAHTRSLLGMWRPAAKKPS